jgi:hypothetical protein
VTTAESESSPAAFYCVADDAYFLGMAGMINSLRIQGHREPIYLLDLGLTGSRRERLADEATLVNAPAGVQPWLAKTVAPRAHPAEVMVLIDADMIATRRLDELVERAAGGMVLAFANESERFFPEWGDLLGLGPLERRPYACSGLVLAGGEPGFETIRLLDERQRRVEFERTFAAANEPGYPFLYPEQDVLNAILASRAIARDAVEVLPYRMAPMPPFSGLEIADASALRCAYADGTEPFVVHHFGVKPWLERTHDGVYSRLLRRLLATGPIEVDPRELPLRLRCGPLASAERRRIDAGQRLRWRLRELRA